MTAPRVLARAAAVAATLLALALPAQGSPDESRDARLIKTAYLYNFLKFVRWPADRGGADLRLCIGRDPALARVAQEALREKRVGELAVRVIGPGESAETCDLRYSARGGPAPLRPAELTVGEGRAFIDQGGMIAFVIIDDRVRFYVNLKALREAGLSADARLLSVAVEVVQ